MDFTGEFHPALTASKQSRILIWRDEVASAADNGDAVSSADGIAPSFTSSSTATTNSSSSTKSPPRSSRSLWKRLSRRLSIMTKGSDALPSDVETSPQTAMYRDMPDAVALAALNQANNGPNEAEQQQRADLADLEKEDSDSRRGGLKEKQERLERAARLLNQTPATRVS
jgi:hypothetical protein